jgi:SAM-dependent methyltransferase
MATASGAPNYRGYAQARLRGAFREYNSWALVASRLAGRRTLDIGCADGLYLRQLAPGSVGIEQMPELIEAARAHGLEVMAGDIQGTLESLSSGSFEGVLFSHALEHVERPIDALREVARVLAPGGVLVLGLPTERNIFRDLLRMDYFAGTHIYSFSVRNAEVLLRLVGLEPDSSVVYHLPKLRGATGVRLHRIFNRVPLVRKEFFSLAYWAVATKP